MTADCVFCNYDAKKEQVICETDNFYVVPTIGQISDGGHVLIIPRHHYTCLGAMEEHVFDEFESLTRDVKKNITAVYQKPLLFEHGILGQSVHHAHLQMLPSSTDLFTRINRDFRVVIQLSSLRELRDLHRTKGVYLFYQNTHDKMFGFILDSFPQYLRIVAAEAIGKPQRGNWREWRADPDCAKLDDLLIKETIEKLRPKKS